MKKALAVLMVLAGVAVATYADVPDVAVTGDATLTWGYGFDEEASGFKNEANWSVVIPLIAKKDFTSKGEGSSYAEISVNGVEFSLVNEEDDLEGTDTYADIGETSDDDGDVENIYDLYPTWLDGGDQDVNDVTAKLHFGNIYVVIANGCSDRSDGGPDFSPEYATAWVPINDDEIDDVSYEPDFTGNHMGGKVGFKTEKFDVGLKIASKYSWDGVTQDRSLYALGVDGAFTPSDKVSVEGMFNYAFWKGDIYGGTFDYATSTWTKLKTTDNIITTGAKAVLTPVDGLSFTAAIDAGNNKAAITDAKKGKVEQVFAWDAIASAKYKFVEAGAYITYAPWGATTLNATSPYVTISNFDGDDADGYDFVARNKDDTSAVGFNPYLKVTDGDFVDGLDAWASIMAVRIGGDNSYTNAKGKKVDYTPFEFGLGASYKYGFNDVNYVKPYFNYYGQTVGLSSEDEVAAADTAKYTEGDYIVTKFSVGVEYGIFSNATVTADYTTGSLSDEDNLMLVDVASRQDKGDLTFACKITY